MVCDHSFSQKINILGVSMLYWFMQEVFLIDLVIVDLIKEGVRNEWPTHKCDMTKKEYVVVYAFLTTI